MVTFGTLAKGGYIQTLAVGKAFGTLAMGGYIQILAVGKVRNSGQGE